MIIIRCSTPYALGSPNERGKAVEYVRVFYTNPNVLVFMAVRSRALRMVLEL